jgi:hypothetical protein
MLADRSLGESLRPDDSEKFVGHGASLHEVGKQSARSLARRRMVRHGHPHHPVSV